MSANLINMENFGPIKSSIIEDSKFTILFGDNCSGKSFTTLLFYTLSNPLDDFRENGNQISNISFDSLHKINENNVFSSIKDNFNIYLNNSPDFKNDPFKIPVNEFETIINEGIGTIYNSLIESKLKSVFEVQDLDKLIRFNENSFKISFNNLDFIKERNKNLISSNILNLNIFNDIFKNIDLNIGDMYISFNIKKDNDFYYLYFNKYKFDEGSDISGHTVLNDLYYSISILFFSNLATNSTYYIPSERDELLKNKNSILSKNLKNNYILSYIQEEVLTNIVDNEDILKKGKFYDLASRMEKDLFDGEIRVRKLDYYNEFYYYSEKLDSELPLNLLSSSINETVPFIFYLKYILKEGDTLIIEEPEAQLHPKNQRKLVKYFIEAINLGLKIIITTHSEYISDQVNIHVIMGSKSKEILKCKFNYSTMDILDYNDVDIYEYKSNDVFNYSTVKIAINSTGFVEKNFSQVSYSIYNELIDIEDIKEE